MKQLDQSEALHERAKISPFRSIVGSSISEGIGFKNVKPNSYFVSSLEEVPRTLEEDYGLLSST